jgi:pyruvate/2-oxoglutarate dehydrogenase complex dihydrolipoamide acyltransferase (E2) component
MGESLAEGPIVRWLKKPGDTVQRDEPLFEISTDKVDTDVPSSAAGVLTGILVAEGQTVAVGTVVATIRGEAAPTEPAGHFKADRPAQLVVRKTRESTSAAAADRDDASSILSPAVLEAAHRAALPLDTLTGIAGSGRNGRITRRDVDRFLAARTAQGPPGGSPAASSHVPAEYLYTPDAEDRVERMTPVRRKIADHMTWSARISPHATAFAECDMSHVVSAMADHRARLEEEWNAPLTYTVVAAKAVVDALRAFPGLNVSVVGDSLAVRPHVNLGIAVALEDTGELIVPVIHAAEALSIGELARAVRDVAGRARARRLTHADIRGGTFTLTNPGIYGGLTGTPILNQPQVGIVGLGAIVKRAVVVNDAIAIRPMMTMALTFDHRAADGMLAFRFLDRIRRSLAEHPLGQDAGS